MNRIKELFNNKRRDILTIYFTAGFPTLNSTIEIIKELDNSEVDMIEIGIPFSDPMADGVIIQESNQAALKNGISIERLFLQLKDIRDVTHKPMVLMGYFNPIMQYGAEKFCSVARKCGVDGIIIPDLPLREYQAIYRPFFEANDLAICFLITPETTEERLRKIDEVNTGFIYLVTSPGVTGRQVQFGHAQTEALRKVQLLHLKNPVLAGFGISNNEGYKIVCKYVNGGIIGSGFISALNNGKQSISENIHQFIKSIKS
ncbi:MAG: tryptophan synthase subunit alpha [Flavipsychrobacter sp.]|nr:tryptophan synthase subunit alpha [Flavipsychrobacter sp.]